MTGTGSRSCTETARSTHEPKPRTVRLRAYNIGFGDCLLLTVTYASGLDGRRERHMLIDFGSS